MDGSPKEEFIRGILNSILEAENKELTKPICMEEVKKETFQLGADKSPGLDGFPTFFYQTC